MMNYNDRAYFSFATRAITTDLLFFLKGNYLSALLFTQWFVFGLYISDKFHFINLINICPEPALLSTIRMRLFFL